MSESKMIAPCKECEKRHINCHEECKSYKAWKNKLIQLRRIKKEKALAESWNYDL